MQATPSALARFEKNIDQTTLGHDAFRVMINLCTQAGIAGLNIWTSEDEGEITYHVDYKDKTFSGSELNLVILQAAGRLPMRTCTKCGRERVITAFVRKHTAANGFSYCCNLCNRSKHKPGAPAALH